MDDLYQEHILDHFQHPRKKGVLAVFSVEAEAVNPSCGDALAIQLELDSEGVVREVGWQGHGCAISQAAASIIAEEMMGEKLVDYQSLSLAEVSEKLGVEISPARSKCAMLVVNALSRCKVS